MARAVAGGAPPWQPPPSVQAATAIGARRISPDSTRLVADCAVGSQRPLSALRLVDRPHALSAQCEQTWVGQPLPGMLDPAKGALDRSGVPLYVLL